jgi:beta-N-acetylhexosaminidase
MAAAFGAGGVKARIDAHLDAGCDVVPVCHPDLVPEALQAMEGRSRNADAIVAMAGRGNLGWDALLADARRDYAQARLAGVPVGQDDVAATSGANDAGYTRSGSTA